MTTPRLRFAPSPTGYLHIGGARTALFNWLWARKTGGTFLLRIEDTDQARSTQRAEHAIFESMRWLGLDWDEGPSDGGDIGPRGPYSQMQRLPIYAAWAEKLIRSGHAYRCYCTDADLAASGRTSDRRAGFKYPGTCRDRIDQPDLPHVLRFKVDRAGSVTYVDKVFGEIETPNKELQDFVLLRGGGVPLYNFGAVVDDITMDVTLVARGRDHMANTPPQILLYKALGARIPDFAHLPMMLGPDGEKLSKRHGAVSVTEYRDRGYSPDAVLDYLSRFGWSAGEHEARLSRPELVGQFDWTQCGTKDGQFDPRKFCTINHQHLQSPRLVPTDEYIQRALPFVHARGLTATASDVERVLPAIRDRAQTYVEAADLVDPLFREPPIMDDKAATKFLVEETAPRLRAIHDVLAASSEWTATALEAAVTAWLVESKLVIKDVGQPLRVALTGRTASPSLFDVLVILGRETSLARLTRAADHASGS